ncbi:MAG: flavin reductase family protein [Chitinophagaceae bacterium]|nr:flavin reductase family protein [Chitinophagaceae bacterium]
MTITPDSLKTAELHAYLLGAISPRPICFASTIDLEGNVNLSPFSFFNIFGSKPTRIIFSPARRVRDNTIKHTLENCKATKEVVINVVNYNMVQQMSLASCEYPKGVNEFAKAGFTEVASEMIKAPRVKESPVQIECKVVEIIETGQEGGAGNLIICEMLCMHINENVLNENHQIDPHKIDLVARMGGDYYCRASGDAVFVVPKPNMNLGIGIDNLPEKVKNSNVFSGNDLGMLANFSTIPEKNLTLDIGKNSTENWEETAKAFLQKNEVEMAWQIILLNL